MTTVTTPVLASLELTRRKQTITADYQSAGDSVIEATGTSRVRVLNFESAKYSIEARVNSGPWIPIEERDSGTFDINLATGVDTLKLRRSLNAPASMVVDLEIFSLPASTLTTPGGQPVNPVSGAGNFFVDNYLAYVVSGLVLPSTGTLALAAVTGGVAYTADGTRVVLAGQIPTWTATRDNYVDLANGVLVVTPVVVGAASPAVPANGLRLGFVTTNGANVTSSTQTGFDKSGAGGVWMHNGSPLPTCILRTGTDADAGLIPFGSGSTKYDNLGMHSETTNPQFVNILVSGFYEVMAAVNWASGSNLGTFVVYRNGSDAQLPGATFNAASTILSAQAGGTIWLDVNDTIGVYQDFNVYDYVVYLTVRKVM